MALLLIGMASSTGVLVMRAVVVQPLIKTSSSSVSSTGRPVVILMMDGEVHREPGLAMVLTVSRDVRKVCGCWGR